MGKLNCSMGCGGSKDEKEGPKPVKPVEKPANDNPKDESKPAAAPANTKAPKPWTGEDLTSMMNDYFTRYDLDGSGTINTTEELKQLCTNLVVKLELDMDVAGIDDRVTSAGDMDVQAWGLEKFQQWYLETFEPPRAGSPAISPALTMRVQSHIPCGQERMNSR